MLEDQTFYPPTLLAVSADLFFDDSPLQINFDYVQQFRQRIQNPGFFSFVYIVPHLDKTYFNKLRDLGIKFLADFHYDPKDPNHLSALYKLLNTVDWVFSPALTSVLKLSRTKSFNYPPSVFMDAVVHFNTSMVVYSKENFEKFAQKIWTTK